MTENAQSDGLESLERIHDAALELIKASRASSQQIEAEELLYLQESRGMQQLRDQVSNIELGMMAQVAGAKDDMGKPVFSNDALRKAEVSERLQNLGPYREANRQLGDAINAQAIREIRIKKLNRDFSIQKLAYEGLVLGRRY